MAVDDDYLQLFHDLGECGADVYALVQSVQDRRMREAAEGLPPNSEDWENLIALRASYTADQLAALSRMAHAVLRTLPGEQAYREHDFGVPPDAPPP